MSTPKDTCVVCGLDDDGRARDVCVLCGRTVHCSAYDNCSYAWGELTVGVGWNLGSGPPLPALPGRWLSQDMLKWCLRSGDAPVRRSLRRPRRAGDLEGTFYCPDCILPDW